MADEWIKMRCDLADDPAVIAMASALACQEQLVVGCLHKLWSWASLHTADGNARGVTSEWVDRFIGMSGFAQAMADQDWLCITSEGLTFPKFDVHNSESAKKRALTNRRVAKHRKEKREERYIGNASTVAKGVTRVEKSREDNSSGENVDRVVIPDWVPDTEWDAFIAMRKRIGKPLHPENIPLVLERLKELAEQGNPVAEVLKRSTRSDYPDLYPLQTGNGGMPAIKWWTTEAGRLQKGKELGIHPHSGESNDSFVARIQKAIDAKGRVAA